MTNPSQSINKVVNQNAFEQFTINPNGKIILSNGQRFVIKRICLEGQYYSMDHPFTLEQKQAIKKVIKNTFTKEFISEVDELDQVKKLTISQFKPPAKSPKVEVKVSHSEGETIFQAELPLVQSLSQMTKIFEDSQKPADRLIEDTYLVKNSHHYTDSFTERLTRESTLLESLAFHRAMIAQIKEKNGKKAKELTYHENQIVLIENYLKENKQKDWLPSPYFRQILSQQKKLNYPKASQQCIAAPVNMRYHDLSLKGEKHLGFYQLGVFSDMRNGWYSLKDLKKMCAEKEVEKKHFKNIDRFKKPLTSKFLTKKQIESAQDAHLKLNAIKDELSIGKKTLVNEMIAERRLFLQTQMVQLIAAQVKMNPDLIKDGEFNLIHLCWLNHTLSSLDPTGWMHDERVEMEDMAEIFKEFNGKKLIFDGSGPRIDSSTIYLPLQEGVSNTDPIKLNTFFFSTTVQKHMKNDKEQADINLEALRAINSKFPGFFKETDLEKRLQPGNVSNYKLAEDLMYHILKSKKFAVSGGCLSAKDRTGFITARIIQRFISDYILTKVSTYKNNFKNKVLLKKGIALSNIRENTPEFNGIKVDVRSDLPGLTAMDRLNILSTQLNGTIQASFFYSLNKQNSQTPPEFKNNAYEFLSSNINQEAI